MPEHKPRVLWATGIGVTVFLFMTSLPVIHFYQAYWPRVSHLPTIVRRREESHGGRWTTLSHVSPWVVEALVATEDRTFDSNIGISFEGIGRSLLVDLRSGQRLQGGSTLTQQLVRDTLLSPAKRFHRKIAEALLSVLATALYSKREILTLYLNQVYLGDGAYGIGKASQNYFKRSPAQLSPAQATLLAGLPQAPSEDDPLIHWRAAKDRQWQVLQSMVADNLLSTAEAQHVFRAPLDLVRKEGERSGQG